VTDTLEDNVARVIANHGAELILAPATGERFSALPKKKLGLIVTGDLVEWEPQPNAQARVTGIVERHGTLARTDRLGVAKPIATNITQLVVVTAPKPPFDRLLIDRYAVAASNINVKLVILINKVDLLNEESEPLALDIESVYQNIGYQVARCSTKNEGGLEQLHHVLADETSILVGQSGVGKSSILNSVLPTLDVKTGGLSDISGLGKHTTTVTNWYDLPQGGAIIDSPGVRQFALEHLDHIDIQSGFKEIASSAISCKFNDCSHVHEPSCAVLKAMENGAIDTTRYEHFRTLLQSEDSK